MVIVTIIFIIIKKLLKMTEIPIPNHVRRLNPLSSLVGEDNFLIETNGILKKVTATDAKPFFDSGGGGGTNLGYTATPTDGTVTSDTGTDATLPAGSTINASLLLPGDKTKLDGIPANAINAANLSYTASPTDGTVTSDVGTNATIPAGSTTDASLLLPSDKTKLDGIPAGAIDAANLGYTASAVDGTVTSDVGTDATIPAGSTTDASLMLPADKTKLDGISPGATPPSTGIISYQIANFTNSIAPYGSASVATNGTFNTSFALPSDFASINTLQLIIIPSFTGVAVDIDVTINSHLSGQLYTLNSVADTTTTYSFTANTGYEIDLTLLFALLPPAAQVPNSRIGIELDHNGIGGTLNYIAVTGEYTRS